MLTARRCGEQRVTLPRRLTDARSQLFWQSIYPLGIDGFVHVDVGELDEVTVGINLLPRWSIDRGGETVSFGRNEEIRRAVSPAPTLLLSFRRSWYGTGGRAATLRVGLQWDQSRIKKTLRTSPN